jgi:glutamate racemase
LPAIQPQQKRCEISSNLICLQIAPDRRVLGVIRPSVEKVSEITKTGHVGVLGTVGTVTSDSYPIELEKWSAGRVKHTVQEACPMWVPIVENNEIETEGAEYFIRKNIQNILEKDRDLDTLILGCTHYPLLLNIIRKYVPDNINILEQGEIVAEKLIEYLQKHPEIDERISKNSVIDYQTTEVARNFEEKASLFLGKPVEAKTIHL